MKKINTVWFGMLSGFLLPVVVFMIVYYNRVSDAFYTLTSHYAVFSSIIPLLISHCILPNIVLFFIFNGTNKMQAAKGVVITTVIMAVGVFAVKLITSLI